MIIKWEIIPYPSEKYPDRYKVNIGCDYADLKKIMEFYGKRCGLPWKSKLAGFSFSFYIYKMTLKGVEEFENKIKNLQSFAEPASPSPAAVEKKGLPAADHGSSVKSKMFPVPEKSDSFFSHGQSARFESRASVFPPRSSKKQPTNEEIKIAKEFSAIVDFDVFDPEKLEAIEIKKENKEQETPKTLHNITKKAPPAESASSDIVKAGNISVPEFTPGSAESRINSANAGTPSVSKKQEGIKKDLPEDKRTISVGIVFRSGQEEFSKIIEDNLLKSVVGKKLKYKIKIVFAKGFLVFSKEDINDVIALCKEKSVSYVIIAGESKLAEVLHELLNSAGIFTEHINTTDVNRKSLYFSIATSIILSETGKKRE